MRKKGAILLGHVGVTVEGKKIAKMLSFFGVSWHALATTELLSSNGASWEGSSECKLMCSADTFLQLTEALECDPRCMQFWQKQVHSAFVYAGNHPQSFQKLVRTLIGDNGAVISKIRPGVGDVTVSDHFDDFCGVMAGIRVIANEGNTDGNFVLSTAKGNLINIISRGDGTVFWKLEYKGVPVFFSTSREIVDIDAELKSQNFDVRDHFLSAVPLVLYIKWAFAHTCWNAPEINACLIIDDPVLKRTHGFVNFQELLSLMKRHKFSTNIAFIPWNWRRSAPEVVRLFRKNPENYSISVHGCDHTRAEFGSSSKQRIYWKTQQATERMDRHRSITGIDHDPVMVFPQGIFSKAAMSALKHTDLIAAVNNDVVTVDRYSRAITISDVWDIAVMGYPFPLFTRRYPWEGIENFAFDALLGKPAIAVIHHDYCSDHCARLVNFIEQLNALPCAPTWRNLGELVRRSCRQREDSPGAVEVEMYGTELRIENCSDQPKHFVIRRRESEPSAIQRICTDAQEIPWRQTNGRIDFEIELNPGENRVIKIKFHDLSGKERGRDNLPYRLKTMLRRYLCEMRDNYVVPMRCRFAGSR
jgi:23S rRNA U2552 (ribose-2'-O)-methylase RlmE/FtsJ